MTDDERRELERYRALGTPEELERIVTQRREVAEAIEQSGEGDDGWAEAARRNHGGKK